MKKTQYPLSVTHPALAEEWHPEKNDNVTPNDVTYGSSKKIWWKCEKGHEWETTINSRTTMKVGLSILFR
ncbi:zinc-ribbon domain-containing protein [Peribacillus sp. NPDC097206]|uniref:zinc-ribbon domain-containing protein n=1 Tax=unclassified Peribacillus TaxID=2675266 RepID=UPI00381DE6DA